MQVFEALIRIHTLPAGRLLLPISPGETTDTATTRLIAAAGAPVSVLSATIRPATAEEESLLAPHVDQRQGAYPVSSEGS